MTITKYEACISIASRCHKVSRQTTQVIADSDSSQVFSLFLIDPICFLLDVEVSVLERPSVAAYKPPQPGELVDVSAISGCCNALMLN